VTTVSYATKQLSELLLQVRQANDRPYAILRVATCGKERQTILSSTKSQGVLLTGKIIEDMHKQSAVTDCDIIVTRALSQQT